MFQNQEIDLSAPSASKFMPLPRRLRPKMLQEFVGQGHLLGKGQLLERLICTDSFNSLIFYGPPGTGKTTLAYIIAQETRRRFVSLSAVTANVAQVRQVIEDARAFLARGKKTILFVDEIHRFNKAQQDVLLPHIEDGVISFIGATTENPFFAIIAPLVSRSHVFRLKSLTADEVLILLQRALRNKECGLGKEVIHMDPEGLRYLATFSQGDARRALSALEAVVQSSPVNAAGERVVSSEAMTQILQEKPILYDRKEDQHYDTISAFIKSVRGSDPDAALYWLAKMIHGGEDVLFIARRLVILASEDIGNADPRALGLAAACASAVEFVGLPEARIPLAQTTIYLACAPKSNASYLAIEKALDAVKGKRHQEVPEHLKNVKEPSEEGQKYKYPHAYEGHFVEQTYLEKFERFLELSNAGYEVEMAERLSKWRVKNRGKKSET